MYVPNFCVECGERLVRERWRLWHSRRFCDRCSPRFRRVRISVPIVLMSSIFAGGFAMGRLMRPAAPPLVLLRSGDSSVQSVTTSAAKKTSAAGLESERITEPGEIVSICGARTKKGTPCSRRVRGTGRCWQHKGMAAMLPAEKLIVTDKAGN